MSPGTRITGARTAFVASGAPQQAAGVDAEALADELRRRISGEVRFDGGSRALYATDGSNYRMVPIGVVVPRTIEDVVETVAVCRQFDVPILPRGGGTSLAGQCCNVAVVFDCSKYLRQILEVDPERKIARVQPGVVCDQLKEETHKHHLELPPDPATHAWCTLGGMIGNDSCGPHSILSDKTGRIVDHVEELDVLTYDGLRLRVGKTSEDELERIIAEGGRRGSIYAKLKRLRDQYADLIRERYPKIPRRVSGYNLDALLPENGFNVAAALVGTEGTCVTVLEATVRLVHSPPERALAVLGYRDIFKAGDHVPEVLKAGPVALEAMDRRFVDNLWRKGLLHEEISQLPGMDAPGDVDVRKGTGGWLIAEFGGETANEARDKAQHLIDSLKGKSDAPQMKLFHEAGDQKDVWTVRDSGLGADAYVPGEPENWEGWEDSAVHPDRLGKYLRDLKQLFDKYEYIGTLYGHFGQGCVHTRLSFDLRTEAGIEKYRSFIGAAADLVVSHGGSLSGEHGDGQSRAEMLPKMYGPELVRAFQEFKATWDPGNKMNPGKMVQPDGGLYRIDQNLRIGTAYNPPDVQTHFQFPGDKSSFTQAALRCVGVGKCRDVLNTGQTMCPSYQVTHEEQHSTRGRARMLFEMLQGQAITGGWKDEHVKEALDLCLACKGCKGDCPVHVDMATYKAEFLAHYFQGRPRPRSAYSMGLIYWHARLASRLPALANFLTQTPLLRDVSKRVAGVAPQRQMPKFAPRTFTQWFRQHTKDTQSSAGGPPSGRRPQHSPRVILWADTFTNHFFPEVADAAVEVLAAAGYQVTVPAASLCCGRPLYDYGFLDQAKGLLRQILRVLEADIAAGVPVVGLEPSCVSVFRDELPNLFPHDEQAKRLSQQTFLFSEFLAQQEDWRPPRLDAKAIVHGHCHQKALMTMDSTERVLAKLGLDYQMLPTGCCGMAGSFGFEPGDHYDVSVKVGELALLPAVRAADPNTLIIADGFSCREQIAQLAGRRTVHLAEVVQMALRQDQAQPLQPAVASDQSQGVSGARAA